MYRVIELIFTINYKFMNIDFMRP